MPIVVEAMTAHRIRSSLAQRQALAYRGDVRRAEDIEAAIMLAKRELGGFDIYVNAAGITDGVKAYPFNMRRDLLHRVIDINLTSVIIGTQLACKHFRIDGKPGVIINVASAAGTVPVFDSPIYACTKAGVCHFTRSMAGFATQEHIRVCALAPTYVRTAMTTQLGEELVKAGMFPTGTTPEQAADLMVESVGGWLPIAAVTKAFMSLVLDNSKDGVVLKITPKGTFEWPRSHGNHNHNHNHKHAAGDSSNNNSNNSSRMAARL